MTGTPNFLIYDIETVANARSRAYYHTKKYEPPSNYKDQEKIDKWLLEAKHKDQQSAALSWWTGQIVCICVKSLCGAIAPKTFVGPDEKAILKLFFNLLAGIQARPILIGKSSEYFDKPFIVGRALAYDLGLPPSLRPFRPIEDVDQIFGFSARCDQITTLANYAFGLGIDGKTGKGTDVQHWYDSATTGQDPKAWQTIGSYCAQDNDIVAEMLRRWAKDYVPDQVKDASTPMPEADIPFAPPALAEPVPVKAKPPIYHDPIHQQQPAPPEKVKGKPGRPPKAKPHNVTTLTYDDPEPKAADPILPPQPVMEFS